MKNLIYGVGINDADYKTQYVINGVKFICPFYQKWRDMLRRCYSKKYQDKHRTYKGCTVYSGWLLFSSFKSWMESQDWRNKCLDKDLLFSGNKHYSPETCVFIDESINKFMIENQSRKGDWPVGVYLNRKLGKFHACCSDPVTKKNKYIGLFDCPHEASAAWKRRKHQLACLMAETQSDEKVANALRLRYTADYRIN